MKKEKWNVDGMSKKMREVEVIPHSGGSDVRYENFIRTQKENKQS